MDLRRWVLDSIDAPPPGFYYVKKTKRFVILSSDKSSERNLSSFFDMIKPRRIENLQNCLLFIVYISLFSGFFSH